MPESNMPDIGPFGQFTQAPKDAIRCPSCMHPSMFHSPAGCVAVDAGSKTNVVRCLCAWPTMTKGMAG